MPKCLQSHKIRGELDLVVVPTGMEGVHHIPLDANTVLRIYQRSAALCPLTASRCRAKTRQLLVLSCRSNRRSPPDRTAED